MSGGAIDGRASGVLLHPSSLPGPSGSGDLGAAARRFVDWLADAGQGLWQVLPLCPTGPGHSPYMSPSSFAIEPALIDLDDLVARGWLDAATLARHRAAAGPFDDDRIWHRTVLPMRAAMLQAAAEGFAAQASAAERTALDAFCHAQRDWLADHALFVAGCAAHPGCDWQDWPAPLARREPQALAALAREHAAVLRRAEFLQWVAHRQWAVLRDHAHARNVRIVGDMPIFVAPHSTDVWAQPSLFDLDANGRPRVVAGVPPDYFSVTGQRWGNPLYGWDAHRASDFGWWIGRLRALLRQADLVRIDHFRGFDACWEVPADATDAISGRWMPGPGAALFEALRSALGSLPIIAEDLGLVTEAVVALRETFGLPGMRVLQFAFAGDAGHAYLPHNFSRDTVVYTGTHDNDTSLGWFAAARESERRFAQVYLQTDGREIGWDLIVAASQSVANLAIYPMQDVLSLDSDARMNRPGVAEGCWDWRFRWSQVRDWHAPRLRAISAAHGRNGLRLVPE
jgi:4-alpha-glucanotransferase